MKLEEVRDHWNRFGEEDPLWAILLVAPDGSPWTLEEFFATGVAEVEAVTGRLRDLGISPAGAALDFGCGVGRLTQAMAALFDQCHGVDIAESMVARARELNRFPDRCTYHLNTRDDLALFGDATFDFVYSSIVLQHVEPAYSAAYIREFLRVLRPGGAVAFQLPSRELPGSVTTAVPTVEGGPVAGLRGVARRVIPAAARRRLRGLPPPGPGSDRPVMEMHCTPRQEVEALVVDSGGEILAVDEDHSCGPGYESFRYFARRPAA